MHASVLRNAVKQTEVTKEAENLPEKSIVTWNIRHGGGANERRAAVIAQLLSFDADLLIVTEFRLNTTGVAICSALAGAGYALSHPGVDDKANSVLVASRDPILGSSPLDPDLTDQRHLWVAELGWLKLCAVYMPLNTAKLPYWQALERAANHESSGPGLFIGDFNTGNNRLDLSKGASPFIASDYFDRFGAGTLVDIWRTRNGDVSEFSWFSAPARNGFRLDHAFATRALNKMVQRCEYDHHPRERGFSDHSALLLTIEVTK